jgi:hypothetical protein
MRLDLLLNNRLTLGIIADIRAADELLLVPARFDFFHCIE